MVELALGGPRVYEMKLRVPGAARAHRQGANLAKPNQDTGHRAREDFLAGKLAR
jgi:hypothetical protein